MRKPTTIIDYSEIDIDSRNLDYKTEALIHDTIQNLESGIKWLYVGADISNPNWVKIGITLGDMGSRSYSSANPNYYIFCAFQFRYDKSEEEVKLVEAELFSKLDLIFKDWYGTPLRMRHYESGKLSECYFPVDFEYFFYTLYNEIYQNYRNYFQIHGYENEVGDIDGDFVSCNFSSKLDRDLKKNYFQKLLRWD